MGGWNTLFDIANLAINVSQSVQLNNSLGNLKVQALQKEVIDALRNFVFSSNEEIKVLIKYKEKAFRPVYVVSSIILWKFQSIGLTASVFSEFRDKEYLQEVLGQLRDLIDETRSKQTSSELEEADQCIDAITQMPLLNGAIEHQTAVEELEETQADWDKLDKMRKNYNVRGWLVGLAISMGAIVMPIFVFFGFLFFGFLGGSVGEIFGNIAEILICNIPPIFIGGILIGLWLGSRGKTKEWRKLKEVRANLVTKKLEEGKVQEIYGTFGAKSSDEYKTIRMERKELIRRVLDETKDLQLPPELSASIRIEG